MPDRRAVAVLVAALALAGCATSTTQLVRPATRPSASAGGCPASPQNATRIGFYAPSPRALAAVEQLTHVQAAWSLIYPKFGDPFPAASACQSSEHGATPIIQIDPYHTSMASIAAGQYDVYLDTFARAVKEFGAPVILSLGHEMNGNWYPWGWTHTPPATFVAAWRRVVTIFRHESATNATWMWTVNINRSGSTVTRNPAAWWPGSQYVGLVGINGYFRYPGDTWDTVFSSVIAEVRQVTSLPLLLSETGVEIGANSYSQTVQMFQGVERNQLVGLVWFNAAGTRDWRLEHDPAALAAFRTGAARF
ncbi:MAG: hypothetical protein J2P27_02160 [Actinobacteria bacterium]|nr:hypothetical protein [Actinomycetota bacterium]